MMTITRQDVPCIDVLKAAWMPFTENLKITVGAAALLLWAPTLIVGIPAGIVAFVVAGGAALFNKATVVWALIPVVAVAMVAFAVVYNAIRLGWIRVLLKVVDEQPTSFREVLTSNRLSFVNFLVCMFIIGIGTAIGGMMFVIPGIYFSVRTCMAPYLVAERNMGPIQALLASHEMVKGYGWQILLYYLLFFAANMLCSFVPIIGMFLPVAVFGFFDLALTMIYRMRSAERFNSLNSSTSAGI